MDANLPVNVDLDSYSENWIWEPVNTTGIVPVARHCHSAVIYEDSLYVFGATNCWAPVKVWEKIPAARHSHSAVVYKDCMYIFGGISDGGNHLKDVHAFDFKSKKFTEVQCKGEIPPERWAHSAVVYKNCMYIVGGYGNKFFNDIHELNLETLTWKKIVAKGIVPKPRQFHTTVVYKNCMYVCGGFAMNNNHQELLEFNFDTKVWSSLSTPISRRGHTSVVYNECMYVWGGRDNDNQRNDMYEYNFETLEWNKLESDGNRPEPRTFHTACTYRGSMFVFGGFSSKQNLNDIYRFKFESEISKEKPRSVSSDLRHLVNNNKFSDIKFLVEGKPIYAHRCILYTRSDHFKAMLENAMRESGEAIITISSTSYPVFLAILEYIYTDNAVINTDIAVDVLIAADLYILPGLKALVEKLLARAISQENVVSLWQLSQSCNASYLQRYAENFMQKRSSEAFDFSVLSSDLALILKKLLQESNSTEKKG